MNSIFSKENVAEFAKAVEQLKTNLLPCFTEKEQKSHRLVLKRSNDRSEEEIDLFAEKNPEKLLEYVKYNRAGYQLVLVKTASFFGRGNEFTVASFRLVEMPGCCGVVISTGAFTDPKFRKRGIGSALNTFRLALAKAIGYTIIMCTAIDDGITEKILNKNGWNKVSSFVNRRTGNTISMYSRNL